MAVEPALSGWHVNREAAAVAREGGDALPARDLTEAYAELDEASGGLAGHPAAAAAVHASRFAERAAAAARRAASNAAVRRWTRPGSTGELAMLASTRSKSRRTIRYC